ncbi:LacI family DNA-binding transcriptional regulator [Corynebacterium pacaense]|uniref:LacI family DNA-binding transcriptional regulator n=1 Tax=Corynebacterium pacaense TaxID=1816684 RepID=UPI0009BB3DB0|nr:LacI family DNA-binding transcriptional regulator [Corynebacterium pacaense]
MSSLDQHHIAASTFADLARDLGVSRAAVSYALNGKPGVSPALRTKILMEARRRGLITKDLDNTSIGSIGMILADLGNPFYANIATAATRTAREQSVELLLSHSADSPEAIAKAAEAMTQHGVKGIILTTLNIGDGGLVRDLRTRRTPIVLLSRRVPQLADIPFDGIDDFRAGYELMAHVISHGYTDIAIATGGFASYATSRRIEGFLAAAKAGGLRIPKTSIMSTSLNVLGGDIAAEYLLESRTLPQVVVCGADAIATGLINRLALAGVSVPGDIAIVGFDGIAGTQHPFLDLTTIVQPTEKMARSSIAKILQLAGGGKIDNPITIHPHKLHVGGSCGSH